MLIPRWRNALTIKNSLVSSTTAATQFCAFHSTPVACEKWKKKWDSNFDSTEQPNKPYIKQATSQKNYIKYATRQKRADTKKALKDLLYMSASPSISFQDEDPLWKFDNKEADSLPSPGGWKDKLKSSARKAPKSHYKKMKRKIKKENFNEDFDMNSHPETTFHPSFGYNWYSNPRRSPEFDTPGFEWRQRVNSWEEQRKRKWTVGDEEFDREEISSSIGSSFDRTTLGLSPRGPLKLEDVKTAFRSSALKWHPDKHQGPSESVAEEKFKLCVNAYKSLCGTLSTA